MKTQKTAFVQYSILADIWAGAGITNALPASNFIVGAIGANQGGVAAADTYHIVETAGTKAWVATGGTVLQLYGGA